MRLKLSVLVVLVSFTLYRPSYADDHCEAVLVFTGADTYHHVSNTDRRKFYYRQICSNNDTSVGLTYKDSNDAFGFNYGSKDAYCNAEKSFDADHSFDDDSSSIVVREALSTFQQCKALAAQGLDTELTARDPATTFGVTIRRTNGQQHRINSVLLKHGLLDCYVQSNGKSKLLTADQNDINYSYPNTNDAWNISCNRRGISTPSGLRYPNVQMIISTSEGQYPIVLNQFDELAANIAAGINERLKALDNRISQMGLSLTTVKSGRPGDTFDLGVNGQWGDCPHDNDVVTGFRNSPQGNDKLDEFKCRTLQLVIPPAVSSLPNISVVNEAVNGILRALPATGSRPKP